MERTNWKNKAMEYALDKKRLKKRIKELTISRDEWKEKSISHKARADKLDAEFKKIKKKLIGLADSQQVFCLLRRITVIRYRLFS
jgi:hypothetical protein